MDVGEVVCNIPNHYDIGEIDDGVVDGRVYPFDKLTDIEESVDILIDKHDDGVFPGRVWRINKNDDVKEIIQRRNKRREVVEPPQALKPLHEDPGTPVHIDEDGFEYEPDIAPMSAEEDDDANDLSQEMQAR